MIANTIVHLLSGRGDEDEEIFLAKKRERRAWRRHYRRMRGIPFEDGSTDSDDEKFDPRIVYDSDGEKLESTWVKERMIEDQEREKTFIKNHGSIRDNGCGSNYSSTHLDAESIYNSALGPASTDDGYAAGGLLAQKIQTFWDALKRRDSRVVKFMCLQRERAYFRRESPGKLTAAMYLLMEHEHPLLKVYSAENLEIQHTTKGIDPKIPPSQRFQQWCDQDPCHIILDMLFAAYHFRDINKVDSEGRSVIYYAAKRLNPRILSYVANHKRFKILFKRDFNGKRIHEYLYDWNWKLGYQIIMDAARTRGCFHKIKWHYKWDYLNDVMDLETGEIMPNSKEGKNMEANSISDWKKGIHYIDPYFLNKAVEKKDLRLKEGKRHLDVRKATVIADDDMEKSKGDKMIKRQNKRMVFANISMTLLSVVNEVNEELLKQRAIEELKLKELQLVKNLKPIKDANGIIDINTPHEPLLLTDDFSKKLIFKSGLIQENTLKHLEAIASKNGGGVKPIRGDHNRGDHAYNRGDHDRDHIIDMGKKMITDINNTTDGQNMITTDDPQKVDATSSTAVVPTEKVKIEPETEKGNDNNAMTIGKAVVTGKATKSSTAKTTPSKKRTKAEAEATDCSNQCSPEGGDYGSPSHLSGGDDYGYGSKSVGLAATTPDWKQALKKTQKEKRPTNHLGLPLFIDWSTVSEKDVEKIKRGDYKKSGGVPNYIDHFLEIEKNLHGKHTHVSSIAVEKTKNMHLIKNPMLKTTLAEIERREKLQQEMHVDCEENPRIPKIKLENPDASESDPVDSDLYEDSCEMVDETGSVADIGLEGLANKKQVKREPGDINKCQTTSKKGLSTVTEKLLANMPPERESNISKENRIRQERIGGDLDCVILGGDDPSEVRKGLYQYTVKQEPSGAQTNMSNQDWEKNLASMTRKSRITEIMKQSQELKKMQKDARLSYQYMKKLEELKQEHEK